MIRKFSFRVKQLAVLVTAISIMAFPTEAWAYKVIGYGIEPGYNTTNRARVSWKESDGIQAVEASQLTLQDIADAKGAWSWIDVDGDGVAERYYLLSKTAYLINGITPDGMYVNSLGQWIVDGRVMHRAGTDKNALEQAALRAAARYGNSFSGIYSGTVQFTGDKKQYYTIEVTQKSDTELDALYSDDVSAKNYEYEFAGVNVLHPGVTMWKTKSSGNGEYLLFYGYNSIIYYNYDGSVAGQLIKIG